MSGARKFTSSSSIAVTTPTANLSTFSRGNLRPAGLANACRTAKIGSYYGSAFVQKWPHAEETSEHLISKNFLGEHPPRPP